MFAMAGPKQSLTTRAASHWQLVVAVAWLLGGLFCISLDQAEFFVRCQRPRSLYGDVEWSWWPPETQCDWGDGPETDPGRQFWRIVYLLAVGPPLAYIAWWIACGRHRITQGPSVAEESDLPEALAPERTLARAVRLWCGRGVTTWPQRHEQRVVDEFGAESAEELLAEIRLLKTDFYSSDAARKAPNLASLTAMAISDFSQRHPDVDPDVAESLGWCYSWDYR